MSWSLGFVVELTGFCSLDMFYEDPNEATVPEDHTPLTADDFTFHGEEVLERQQAFLNNTAGDFDLGAVRGLIFHLLPSLNSLPSVLV